MRVLAWVLIILCVFTVLVPLRDYGDDEVFNFSGLKRSIESVQGYQEPFLDDLNRLGLISQALSSAITEGKKVDIEYATKNEWNYGGLDFATNDGYMSFRLRIRTDATDETYVYYPTTYRIGVDSWEDYRDYVKSIYSPVSAFLDIYNEYIDSDNLFTDIILMIGLIGAGIFAIIYMLIVFLFDSIAMLWGVLLCAFRILGIVPIPV